MRNTFKTNVTKHTWETEINKHLVKEFLNYFFPKDFLQFRTKNQPIWIIENTQKNSISSMVHNKQINVNWWHDLLFIHVF
jgi:hypothetical protein